MTDEGPREVELKYAVADLAALRTALDTETIGGLTTGQWAVIEVEDRYLDTADGALELAGFGVRLRRRDGRTTLTVKSLASRAGGDASGDTATALAALHDRLEYEAPATSKLDPAAWPESEARTIVERLIAGEPLHTLFAIRQRREERPLGPADAPVAMLTIDAAEVRHTGRSVGTFGALEVESVDGSLAALAQVAEALASTGLVEPEARSKEEIARAMVRVARAEADEKAAAKALIPKFPGVRADDSLAEAGRKVLLFHFARMVVAEPGTRLGEDIEPLHKMRVATRRMRAVWRVFDGAYRPKFQKRYVAELRTVATALGMVRDLDVLLEGLTAHRAALGPDAANALAPLAAEWQRRREAGRTELLTLLDSRDYQRFLNDYRSFVETAGAGALPVTPGAPISVRDTAAGRTWQAYERLRAHDAGLPWADVPALHALRIDAKRLRYTLESFREVLPQDVDQLIAAIVGVQDHIGALNDAQVTADMTREWLVASAHTLQPDEREATGAYLSAREHEVARLRRTFGPVWRRVIGPTFRRRLALDLSSL